MRGDLLLDEGRPTGLSAKRDSLRLDMVRPAPLPVKRRWQWAFRTRRRNVGAASASISSRISCGACKIESLE
jgi:hypothetical protein